jgi:3-isopropylmalate dehydrogenase
MMLKYSFNLEKEAQAIEDAVNKVLDDGYRTGDIILASEDASKFKKVGTKEMGDAVAANI